MIMSCGMASVEEIRDALDACKQAGNDQIVLLKCCSEYPANWNNMHISNIPDMIGRFGVPVGLSDHSAGHIASVVAVSMGACVIEKHVKIDGIDSADSGFSMTMEDFALMVQAVRDTKAIIGDVNYGPSDGERGNLKFRRSLFAVRDIKAGEMFTTENVRSIRPSDGISPKHLSSILGKAAKTDIPYGTPLSFDMIDE